MTTLAPSPVPTRAGTVTFPRVVGSEWTKFRSLRSTWWSLAAAAALAVGLGLLAVGDSAADGVKAGDPVHVAKVAQFGLLFSQLAVLVVAALFVTGEYGTGMIRSSLTVVPRRGAVLLAKTVVVATVVAVLGAATSLATFLIGNQVWHHYGHPGASLGDDGVLPVLLGAPLYLIGAAAIAVATGVLLRNSAGTVTVLVAVFLVVPTVVRSVPGLADVTKYLPSEAGMSIVGLATAPDPLSGGTGLALLVGYAVALVALALGRLQRSDV